MPNNLTGEPLDDTAIKNSIRARGYPDDLQDSEIQEAINSAIREVGSIYTLQSFGSFQTVALQQVYDLFSTGQPFAGGLRALEVIWAPTGTLESLDIFGLAPLLQGLTLFPGPINAYSFNVPGDFTMWDLSWGAFVKRFGSLRFEHTENRSGSPIRLYPTPRVGGQTIFLSYTKPRDLANIHDEDTGWFLKWVEALCCQTLANKFALVAGTKFGDHADTGKLMEHFEKKSAALFKEAREWLESTRYQTIAVGDRT